MWPHFLSVKPLPVPVQEVFPACTAAAQVCHQSHCSTWTSLCLLSDCLFVCTFTNCSLSFSQQWGQNISFLIHSKINFLTDATNLQNLFIYVKHWSFMFVSFSWSCFHIYLFFMSFCKQLYVNTWIHSVKQCVLLSVMWCSEPRLLHFFFCGFM